MMNKNNMNKNNKNNYRSEYVHVWKERSTPNHDIYRITPRGGPNMSFLEGPVTSVRNFIAKVIALILTPVIFLILLGFALKGMEFVGHILSDFWINHENDVWNVVDFLMGQK